MEKRIIRFCGRGGYPLFLAGVGMLVAEWRAAAMVIFIIAGLMMFIIAGLMMFIGSSGDEETEVEDGE